MTRPPMPGTRVRRFTCCVVLLFFAAAAAVAFTLEPITRDFTASGQGATQTFRLTNPDNHPVAVKVTMVHREMNPQGKETYTDASDLFVVFPSQVVLKADTSQVVRVQWRGPAKVESEQNFRIIAEELPVDFGETHQQGGNISILFRYLGSVYVTPSDASPDVKVAAIETVDESSGRHGFLVTFENDGTAHVLMNDLTLTITGLTADGGTYDKKFQSDDLKGANGENMLAGHKRVFYVPVQGTEPLPERNLHAEFSFTPVR
jgi:fimbrial chaperone protein